MSRESLSTLEKALEVNLDEERYGTFAEIGAGQEVVRWFFQAGGAAGTVSKSISAYDMQVSDAIYGACQRYVSRQRLEAMLRCEQDLNRERLSSERGAATRFFSFADTVSARNYHGTNECHAWMGIRFQAEPGAADSVIVIHARMLDDTNAAQQEALGVLGVNLIHAAFHHSDNPTELIASLLDSLSVERIEIDMIDVSGPAFAKADNRVLTLRLVQLGLTGAAMFGADGNVLQPSEALRKRALLVQRGRFRPITHVNMDILQSGLAKFATEEWADPEDILPIMEISMQNLLEDTDVCLQDFVDRAEVVAATGGVAMISDFPQYHRLADYLCRYTERPIALTMGLESLKQLFNAKYYGDLDGGILEGIGRLFCDQVRVLAYPVLDNDTERPRTLQDVCFNDSLQHLFAYLCELNRISALDGASTEYLNIHSHDVLRKIRERDASWMDCVPAEVAQKIIEQKLFGYEGGATVETPCEELAPA